MTAGAAFVVAGKAADLRTGVALAEESIASGKAMAALDKLIAVSRG